MTTKTNQIDLITWKGEADRPLSLLRPCPCGCDHRDAPNLVGYLTGSDEHGDGFTLRIFEEELFVLAERIIAAAEETP